MNTVHSLQGLGHLTSNCYTLKHAVQDLIDHGNILAPEIPNVASNPLPNHGAWVKALFTEEDGPDPVHLIKPIENGSKVSMAHYLELRLPHNFEVKKEKDLAA